MATPEDDAWTGTAWVTGQQERLVITNWHVVFDHKAGRIIDNHCFVAFFPEFRRGHVIADAEHYANRAKPIHGTIVSTEKRADLAMLQPDSLPSEVIVRREALDPAFAEAHKKTYNRKYLRMVHNSGDAVRLYLLYHTLTTKDEWKWFPRPPGTEPLSSTLQPGGHLPSGSGTPAERRSSGTARLGGLSRATSLR